MSLYGFQQSFDRVLIPGDGGMRGLFQMLFKTTGYTIKLGPESLDRVLIARGLTPRRGLPGRCLDASS